MKRRIQRGYTLVEVLVSSSILAVLLVATAGVTTVMQRTTAATVIRSDVQRSARRVLAQIRSEVRQSGWEGSTDRVAAPLSDGVSTSVLTFQTRTGLGDGEWSNSITYQLSADGVFKDAPGTPARYRFVRVSNGLSVDLAANVTAFSCVRDSGSDTIRITLTFMARGERSEDVYLSSHTDEIMLLNPKTT